MENSLIQIGLFHAEIGPDGQRCRKYEGGGGLDNSEGPKKSGT